MINEVRLIGNLGRDAEVRYAPSGMAVANLSLATTESLKDGKKRTEWHRIVAFDKLAELMGEMYQKGKQVFVSGRLQTRKWTDKDGVDRWTTEIVCNQARLLGPAPATASGPPIDAYDEAQGPAAQSQAGEEVDDMDDEIPF